jgi:predicted DNA-binding transcriptional regulator YafY
MHVIFLGFVTGKNRIKTLQNILYEERLVKPVAVLFSEYYFYLIAFMADGSKDFPTTFRIDRITDLKGIKQHFNIPYKDKFNDGEFRKRVQFMYSGELMKIQFKFWGPSLEAVLDRLPTAKIIAEDGEKKIIEAEVFGMGIKMWLLSQSDSLEVIKPKSFREEIMLNIKKMHEIYGCE